MSNLTHFSALHFYDVYLLHPLPSRSNGGVIVYRYHYPAFNLQEFFFWLERVRGYSLSSVVKVLQYDLRGKFIPSRVNYTLTASYSGKLLDTHISAYKRRRKNFEEKILS